MANRWPHSVGAGFMDFRSNTRSAASPGAATPPRHASPRKSTSTRLP